MTVRTRFSPSPTGMIHLGNARAALFSALYAKKHKGVFVLRIEDTDAKRSEERFVEMLEDDLHWLGVDWQEGPGKNTELGPYWQSQRQSVYDKYYQILEAEQKIYPCFCSDQELQVSRKLQLSRSQPPRYSGKCSKLTKEDVAKLLEDGKKPTWRFKVADNEEICFTDLVKGPQKFNSNDIGDFIIRRADGTPPFLFCNAVDDAEMKVTHVLRGEDHVANTPRQIMILNTLRLPVPEYGHLSLITGDDGAPLSKRHGSFSLNQLREQGYLPQALMNYLVRLGHICESQDLLNFDGLAEQFDVTKLSRSPARSDLVQLRYWQKITVQALDDVTFWRWVGERVADQVPLHTQSLFAETVKSNIEFPDDALYWAKILFHENVKIEENDLSIFQQAGEQYFVEAEQAVAQYGTDLPSVLNEMKKTLGLGGKKLFMPFRLALTGRTHGPELVNIAQLLGKEKMKHRIGQALKKIS